LPLKLAYWAAKIAAKIGLLSRKIGFDLYIHDTVIAVFVAGRESQNICVLAIAMESPS